MPRGILILPMFTKLLVFNPFSTYHPVTGSQVRLTTLLPIFAHSSLICGPIDSKPSANERELNSLSPENLAIFFFKQLPAAARSSYVGETNVVAKAIDSPINRSPCIALAKPVEINRTFDFQPFLETIPPKQWPIWPVQDATDRERKN
jgi:hypothetical protein